MKHIVNIVIHMAVAAVPVCYFIVWLELWCLANVPLSTYGYTLCHLGLVLSGWSYYRSCMHIMNIVEGNYGLA